MDSVVSAVVVTQNDKEASVAAYVSTVDPFLVEALQNPRHRLTILRMELDIQKFLQNSDLHQFEFQHFPTSYLRLAAHRVAQHYGLQSLVQDSGLDGQGTKILVRKKPESRYPAVCLSDVPAKQLETDKHEKVKIAIRPRPSKQSSAENGELGSKRNPARTVEERKEEYDRARARIFSSPISSELEDPLGIVSSDGKTSYLNIEDNESSRNSVADMDKNIHCRETGTSRVAAIFRDREKDRTDPDYDRSYERYVKNVPAHQSFSLMPYVQKFQHPYVQYDSMFPQPSQMPGMVNYRSPVMSPFCATGLNQTSTDPVYLQWPSQAMMYAHSYDQLRHAVFQAPMCQQPLTFDYSQNH